MRRGQRCDRDEDDRATRPARTPGTGERARRVFQVPYSLSHTLLEPSGVVIVSHGNLELGKFRFGQQLTIVGRLLTSHVCLCPHSVCRRMTVFFSAGVGCIGYGSVVTEGEWWFLQLQSRSETRVGRRHATPATIPTPTSLPSDPRTFDLRQASRNPRATRRRRETRRSVAFVHLGISGQSPMMGGRNRSNRRSFVRVILNSPPRHASFRPRTFPRVSPTTRVALAGDGAGGGCVCRFVMILSSLSSLLPRPFPPPRAPTDTHE